ncbi:hypothetical protein FB451DRAFT_1188624 [Mycena latifolia]|nr:hypothetical protein FB451DRAFT_1188624 [Mycena latifolia]
MVKHYRKKPDPDNDSKSYRPLLTKAQKAENHRASAKAYYQRYGSSMPDWWMSLMQDTFRHPEICEKNRLRLQERRAAARAKKRRWDPIKPAKDSHEEPFVHPTDAQSDAARSSCSFDAELLSDGLLNGSLHFRDPRGATTDSAEDSAFQRVDEARRVATATSEINAASAAPATPDECIADLDGILARSQDSVLQLANQLSSHSSQDSDFMGIPAQPSISRHVQDAQATVSRHVRDGQAMVAGLNAGPLTLPTDSEARRWVRRTFGFWGHFLQYRRQSEILSWRQHVWMRTEADKALRGCA